MTTPPSNIPPAAPSTVPSAAQTEPPASADIDAELAAVAADMEQELVSGASAEAAARVGEATGGASQGTSGRAGGDAERALEAVAADLEALQAQARADAARAMETIAQTPAASVDGAPAENEEIAADFGTIEDLDATLAAEAANAAPVSEEPSVSAPAAPAVVAEAEPVDATIATPEHAEEPALEGSFGGVLDTEAAVIDEALAADLKTTAAPSVESAGAVAPQQPEKNSPHAAGAEDQPADRKPAEAPAPTPTPAEAKPAEAKPAEAKPAEPKAAAKPKARAPEAAAEPEAKAKRKTPSAGVVTRPLVLVLTLMNAPLRNASKGTRDLIGLAALVTLMNAAALWLFLMIRKG